MRHGWSQANTHGSEFRFLITQRVATSFESNGNVLLLWLGSIQGIQGCLTCSPCSLWCAACSLQRCCRRLAGANRLTQSSKRSLKAAL